MDLPAEMRVSIYQELLPHDMEIRFDIVQNYTIAGYHETSSGYAGTRWRTIARQRGDSSETWQRLDIKEGVSLFVVNRLISGEGRGKFNQFICQS